MESGLENTQILNIFKMSMGTQCQITLYIQSSSLEERFFFPFLAFFLTQ